MPTADQVNAFAVHAARRLEEPLQQYYASLAAIAKRPGPLSGLRRRGAKVELIESTVLLLERLMADAAFLGTDGNPLTPAIAGVLRLRFAEQARYLRLFLANIEAVTEAAALSRIHAYIPAIVQMVSLGAATGLPPLPVMPGSRTLFCKGFCKCHLRPVRLAGAGNYDVYWVLGDARHCPDCIRLAAEWNPLQIRNGVITGGKQLDAVTLQRVLAIAAIAYREVSYAL